MTVRDELHYEIEQLLELSAKGDKHWEWEGTYEAAASGFLRDHGPALLEALDGVVISKELANYLYGSGPLDGDWFGDHNPNKNPYWWRNELGKAIDRARGGES